MTAREKIMNMATKYDNALQMAISCPRCGLAAGGTRFFEDATLFLCDGGGVLPGCPETYGRMAEDESVVGFVELGQGRVLELRFWPATGRHEPIREWIGIGPARYIGGEVVYFISDGEHIKIGFSARGVESRLKSLTTGNPRPLEVLLVIPGSQILERQLHARFVHLRTHGEWFRAAAELLDYIEGHRKR